MAIYIYIYIWYYSYIFAQQKNTKTPHQFEVHLAKFPENSNFESDPTFVFLFSGSELAALGRRLAERPIVPTSQGPWMAEWLWALGLGASWEECWRHFATWKLGCLEEDPGFPFRDPFLPFLGMRCQGCRIFGWTFMIVVVWCRVSSRWKVNGIGFASKSRGR